MRERLAGVPGRVHVTLAGSDLIRVRIGRNVPTAARAWIVPVLTQTTQLAVYDWEAEAITPNGKTVASQLASGDREALVISQGAAGSAPGYAGAGALPLYQAVLLASRQPAVPSAPSLSRLGSQYYLFGRARSGGCAAVSSARSAAPCLLAGPIDEAPRTPRAQAVQDLVRDLPSGVTSSGTQVLAVPQGVVVLQAADPGASQQTAFTGPNAHFFVLHDEAALTGNDITHPTPSRDAGGAPAVQFRFTAAGAARFQDVTARVARRGAHVSVGGMSYLQHFAIALNNQLLTVPSIDFRQYPDGIIQKGATAGADIAGALTPASAHAIASQVRRGIEPLTLRVTGSRWR